MKYDFKKQLGLDFVKEAENRCIKYLLELGLSVKDVSNDENYYKLGIDIIIQEPDSQINIDVKADNVIADTGNLFYEIIECFWNNCNSDIKIGWGLNKNLHRVYYVDVKNWILYIIDKKKLYQLVWSINNGNYRLIPHNEYKTIGFLIPIKSLGIKGIAI